MFHRREASLVNSLLLKVIWVISCLGLLGTFLVLWKSMARLCIGVAFFFETLKIVCVYTCAHTCYSMHEEVREQPGSPFFPSPGESWRVSSDHHT